MKKHRVSVVMPAYNEEEGIEDTIKGFKKISEVTEIVIADNNCTDRTPEIAKKLGAKVVKEPRQGYGFACQTALRSGTHDIIILTESDQTFDAEDIYKLLAYIDDADMVIGTRTCKNMIRPGAKMNTFLRIGNIFVAKLLELTFHEYPVRLTDVGCTFRAIKKDKLKKIEKKFTVGKGYFSPEMIIEALANGLKIIEVPVHYGERKGQSKITANFQKSLILGIEMIALIFKKRIEYAFQ
jgi:glycosyltransferase involved in cell wall biosynthesis